MTHICYIYIYSYRLLKNVGITFDHNFVFQMEDGCLRIEKSDALPKDFFGNGVYSVSAIVGNNGAGKTSALRFLMEAVVEGYRIQDMAGVIVYENSGKIFVYQTESQKNSRLRIESTMPYTKIRNLMSIPVMYYSGHFSPLYDRDDILASELSGSYIASDQWLLVHDLLNYSNYDSIYMVGRMASYIWAYRAQNNARICELLMLDDIGELIRDLRLPRYILIGYNDSGGEFLANDYRDKIAVQKFVNQSRDIKQNTIARLIYTNFINLIAEKRNESDIYLGLLDSWQKVPKSSDILNDLVAFANRKDVGETERKMLLSVHYVLNKLVTICNYDDNSNVFYVEIEKGKDQLRELIEEIFNSHFYLTSRFFDIYYSHGLYTNTVLSSGEQEMLNLLSRLYFGITLQPIRIGNRQSPALIILDEAEIGFHPEWQRKYVNLLLQFLNTKMLVKPGVHFQLVITSHSPIILSDIPLCCVNILQKNENQETEVRKGESETFGENVFNLYCRAFVMKDGLVGAFASAKIKDLYDRIGEGDSSTATLREVMMIGDERIKNYLLSEMSRHDKDFIDSYYQRRLGNIVEDEEN